MQDRQKGGEKGTVLREFVKEVERREAASLEGLNRELSNFK